MRGRWLCRFSPIVPMCRLALRRGRQLRRQSQPARLGRPHTAMGGPGQARTVATRARPIRRPVGRTDFSPRPGAPTGLLGAGSQSAAWLNVSYALRSCRWRPLGMPSCHLASTRKVRSSPHRRPAIFWSVAIVIVLVCALTAAVTAAHDFMPRLLDGRAHFAFGILCQWNDRTDECVRPLAALVSRKVSA